jgi:hypothetical protein
VGEDEALGGDEDADVDGEDAVKKGRRNYGNILYISQIKRGVKQIKG